MSRQGPSDATDHFDGSRFFNPHVPRAHSAAELTKMLRAARAPWPSSIPVTRTIPVVHEPGELVFTSIGHASFLIQTDAGHVLTDPVFANRASPVQFAGPRRVRQPGIRMDDLPAIDLILLSHNHYDHCDVVSLRRLIQRHDPACVTPLGNAKLLRSLGASDVTELDWWERTEVGKFGVTVTPAQHFSARTPFDRNRSLWGGFVIETGAHHIYFVGDSGYGPHFKDIGIHFPSIDIALIPIGAYDPRWFMRPIHMNPEEAVQAHIDVGAIQSIAIHHGVFQLTSEPIDEPVERLAAALIATGLSPNDFQAPLPGEVVKVEAPQRA